MADVRIGDFQNFKDYLEKRRPSIEESFRNTLSGLLQGPSWNDPPSLRKTLEAGKKIRGCLTCLINEGLGGDPASSLPRAVAVELVQAATLIHDDFVDQDRVRGCRPAVWTIEGPRRAILIGDVLFATAIANMSELSPEDGSAISRAIAQIAQGALREPLDPARLAQEILAGQMSGRLYNKIIHLKTATLFGTACYLGALAAEADDQGRRAAYSYGLKIGEAYQIADDLKEMRGHLASKSINPKQMAALAPALLHFTDDMGRLFPEILNGRTSNWVGPVLDCLALAAERMEQEITRRLPAALSENLSGHKGYVDLITRTPGDIIRMFNENKD